MLSLSPRFDLFHFEFPKDYFPEELLDKYTSMLQKNSSVIDNALDYLNESIVGITIPGISDLSFEQGQVSHHNGSNDLDIEPYHKNMYNSSENILSKIDNSFTITFRQNQGLLNYYMMYETTFYRYCKPTEYNSDHDVFNIDILGDNGVILSQVKLFQPIIDAIDGLEFSYNKYTRESETFNVQFKFNNIDFEFITMPSE